MYISEALVQKQTGKFSTELQMFPPISCQDDECRPGDSRPTLLDTPAHVQ